LGVYVNLSRLIEGIEESLGFNRGGQANRGRHSGKKAGMLRLRTEDRFAFLGATLSMTDQWRVLVESGCWRSITTLPAGNGADDEEGLFPRRDRLREWSVRRLVGQVFLASEESQKRPPLQRIVVANRAAQHGITGLERVEDRPLRDGTFDLKFDLATHASQCSQVLWKFDSDH